VAPCWQLTTVLCTSVTEARGAGGGSGHSFGRYLDGQGRVMAGTICGPSRLIVDVFRAIVRTAGMTLSPF
jgi:hypothetical protein